MKASKLLCGIILCFGLNFSSLAGLPDGWTVRSSPSTNQLNGVAYGNGLFVAAGSKTTILMSWNGRDWIALSAGTTVPTLYAAAYGGGRYIVGGGDGALIHSSTDGIHWTNGLSTLGIEQIHGLTFGYGLFVAVGSGPPPNSSYILTSSNGLDWISRTVPTTNRLLAVSPAIGANGVGWADNLFVAVGELGTIVTSTDGVNWVARNSGTTLTLRAVTFSGRFLVGGDSGTILASSDGISWPMAAPTSFDVRALAGNGNDAVVAVGNYATSGRLHASADGLTWPGFSLEFPQPLNAVAYGDGSFVTVGDAGLIVQSTSPITGPTNEWTKPTSGYWEEPFWSLGRLPALDQALVAFRNPCWKALAIGKGTTANYPGSLSIQNLSVDAPSDSSNQLLLNYAGLDVPLVIHSDFNLGSNGSLVSYYSALRGGSLYLSGPATFSGLSQIRFGQIVVGANASAELDLTNSSLSAGLLIVSQGGTGTVNQCDGSTDLSALQMNAASTYRLNGGTFLADKLELQSLDGNGLAQFTMSRGYLDVQGPIRLGQPRFTYLDARAEFRLDGGCFRSRELDFLNGTFTQTGGTNATPRIALPLLDRSRGEYLLSGGMLISSNVTMGAVFAPDTPAGSADFVQSGGIHSNSTLQLFGEIRRQAVTHYGVYSLSNGVLASDSILLMSGAFNQSGGTNRAQELTLSEAGLYILNNGELITSNTTVMTCCCVQSHFLQNDGNHTIQNRLLLQDFVDYRLLGGILTAPIIEIGPSSEFFVQGGVICNSGVLILRSGALRPAGQTLQLGQLKVVGEPTSVCATFQPTGPTLDVGVLNGIGATVLRFADSRDVPWSGSPLFILNWSPTTNGFGPDHVFVGTNSQGLASVQLSQIVFVNPFGSPPGNYPAQILSTGEIVPAVPPPVLYFTRTEDSLILTWTGIFDLLTATNVTGPYLVVPGAASPQTILFTDPQRFFRLGSSAP